MDKIDVGSNKIKKERNSNSEFVFDVLNLFTLLKCKDKIVFCCKFGCGENRNHLNEFG